MKIDKLSDVFGGKVPGLNAPLRFSDAVSNVEKAVSKDKLGNPEKLAFSRLEQQKGLSLFGDKDKDKVFNVFDCKPLDRMNQGFFDKVSNLWKGKGWVDKPGQAPPKMDIEKTESEIALRSQPTVLQQDVITAGRGLKTVGGAVATGATKIGAGIAKGTSNILYSAGVFKTPEEKAKLAIQREEERKFRREAQKEIELAKIRARTPIKKEDEYSRRGYKDFDRDIGRNIERFESKFGGFGRDLSTSARFVSTPQAQSVESLIGLGRGGTGMSAAYELTRTSSSEVPFSVKVDELFGKGEMAKQWRETRGAVQQPSTQLTQPAPPVRPQTPYAQEYTGDIRGEGKVYSPLSKKYVRYPRGPYKRRRVIYQQPYQQPV